MRVFQATLNTLTTGVVVILQIKYVGQRDQAGAQDIANPNTKSEANVLSR